METATALVLKELIGAFTTCFCVSSVLFTFLAYFGIRCYMRFYFMNKCTEFTSSFFDRVTMYVDELCDRYKQQKSAEYQRQITNTLYTYLVQFYYHWISSMLIPQHSTGSSSSSFNNIFSDIFKSFNIFGKNDCTSARKTSLNTSDFDDIIKMASRLLNTQPTNYAQQFTEKDISTSRHDKETDNSFDSPSGHVFKFNISTNQPENQYNPTSPPTTTPTPTPTSSTPTNTPTICKRGENCNCCNCCSQRSQVNQTSDQIVVNDTTATTIIDN